MRTITLALPDDVRSISAYYKMTDGAIHQVEVLSSGAVVDDLVPVKRSIDSHYVEGLEKRIDALEAELREEIPRRFGVAHDTFVNLDKRIEELEETFNKRIQKVHDRLNQFNERFANLNSHIDAVEGTFIERTDRLEKRIAAHAKSIASTDADIGEWCDDTDKLEKRMDELENRLAKLEKPCIDAEAFDKALDIPKVEPVPDIALENRGPYTDILRRLSALEAHFNDSDSEQKQLAEDIKATNGRIQNLEEKTGQTRDRLYAY